MDNITCTYCKGERYDPTYRGAPAEDGGPDPCPLCDGKGVLPEDMIVCSTCGGRGEEMSDSMTEVGVPGGEIVIGPCPACEGKGARSTKPKYLDMTEFREAGFLQEANRQFFHPLGLALEWNSGWTEEGLRSWAERSWPDRPHDEEMEAEFEGEVSAIWRFITETGLDKPRISNIWDERHDPIGVIFGTIEDDGTDFKPWNTFPADEVRQKAFRVAAERDRHSHARHMLTGGSGTVQEIPPAEEGQ